jgi:transposase
LVSPLKRTWAPRGQTPTIRTSIEHNERLNLIGALCVSPKQRRIKLRLQGYSTSITGDEVLLFLKDLLRSIPGPIVMIWDKHPIHGRKQVKAFLACHPRLRVYDFPTAAPELNPTEFVWTQVTEYTASTAPRNGRELRANIWAAVTRTGRSPSRLWGCIFGSDLPWKPGRRGH